MFISETKFYIYMYVLTYIERQHYWFRYDDSAGIEYVTSKILFVFRGDVIDIYNFQGMQKIYILVGSIGY